MDGMSKLYRLVRGKRRISLRNPFLVTGATLTSPAARVKDGMVAELPGYLKQKCRGPEVGKNIGAEKGGDGG